MIETYLAGRSNLKGVVLILDIRRTPGPEELILADWLTHYHIASTTVLTKADKLSRSKQQAQKRLIADRLSASGEKLILFSAKTRMGSDAVWKAIHDLLNQPPAAQPKR
jgi:GTP-binding protein